MLDTSATSTSSVAKTKSLHSNFCNDPNHNHLNGSGNHDLDNIKLIVNYSENGGVKTRTSRLVENDSYARREDDVELKRINSINKYVNIRSPSSSPPPRLGRSRSVSPVARTTHSPLASVPHKLGRSPSASLSTIQFYYQKQAQYSQRVIKRDNFQKRSRSRSRSRTPLSK